MKVDLALYKIYVMCLILILWKYKHSTLKEFIFTFMQSFIYIITSIYFIACTSVKNSSSATFSDFILGQAVIITEECAVYYAINDLWFI